MSARHLVLLEYNNVGPILLLSSVAIIYSY